jgi:hypothetical protein
MAQTKGPLPTVDLLKLRNDLQTIMDVLNSTTSDLDAYSPYMWSRLQKTADQVAKAINAVRMHLAGKTAQQIAEELGLKKQQVAAYAAWNTMYRPGWAKKNEERKRKEAAKKLAQYIAQKGQANGILPN